MREPGPEALGERHVTDRRQPLQVGGEHDDQQDGQPELRHGQAEEGEERDRVVEGRMPLERRDSPAGTAIAVAIRNESAASDRVRGSASTSTRDTSMRLPQQRGSRSRPGARARTT